MGCANSRDKGPEEEHTLSAFEQALRLYRQLTTSVDFGFRKYSHDGEVNASQFAEACQKLHVQRLNTNPLPTIEAFYDRLRKANGNIELKKILLLGVLLSRGSAHEKAQILFEIYDESDVHVLEGPTMRQMVEDLYDMSVNVLPTLVPATGKAHDSQKVKFYLERINYRSSKSRDMLLMALTGGDVRTRRDAFIGNLCKEDRQCLLSAGGIRQFCYKYWQSTPSSLHLASIAKSGDRTEAQQG
jgi:hypothetical protein